MTGTTKRVAGAAVLWAGAACGGDAGLGGNGYGNGGVARLETPEAAFDRAFSVVQTVREMPDGRVLVADPLGQALMLVDLDAGGAEVVGAVGEGPDEYQQPDAVWPLPEGRTLLVDLGNSRLTALTPELEFGETRPIVLGKVALGAPMTLAIPQGVDGMGRIYARSVGGLGGGPSVDSAYVLRIDLEAQTVDSVTRFKTQTTTRTSSGGNESISSVPLSPADAWGVAEDGRVVVARVGESRVEWIAPDGAATAGPSLEYERFPIGQAEKEAWRESRAESGGGLSISVFADGATLQMSFARGRSSQEEDAELDGYPWPEELPVFYNARLPVDGSGRAWARMHGPAEEDAPSTYHVFNVSGEREMIVELAPGRRVVGFGAADKVYVIRMDEVGLQYLERYAMP